MAKYKIDSDLEKEVQSYMKDVLSKLKSDNEKIDETYTAALTMLAENYNMFIKCREQIKNDGLTFKDRFGNVKTHPLLKVQNDSQIQAMKLFNEFGFTSKSDGKIGTTESNEEETPLTGFLQNKMKKEVR